MKATTKSLLFFLMVYIGSTGVLGSIIVYHFYLDEKSSVMDKLLIGMRNKAVNVNAKLEYYHNLKGENFTFYEEGYGIALFDNTYHRIAGTFDDTIDFSKTSYIKGNDYYLVESIFKEYLGVKYIVIRKNIPVKEIEAIRDHLLNLSLLAFVFLLLIAILLAKIMLSPTHKVISTLKSFIKNTTHEMNTPISTILMSYEHMDKSTLTSKQLRALWRIEIATKTLSELYNDLTYLSFHDYINYEDKPLDVEAIVKERIKYMGTLVQFKGIGFTYDLQPKTVQMDKRKLVLIIDNLLSNAIKFSRKSGEIKVILNENYFMIKDNGIGISKEEQKRIFKRFKSSNFETGFGVGLDIVYQICKEYGIEITLDSVPGEGSEFKLFWPH